jgi:hypothetical protein
LTPTIDIADLKISRDSSQVPDSKTESHQRIALRRQFSLSVPLLSLRGRSGSLRLSLEELHAFSSSADLFAASRSDRSVTVFNHSTAFVAWFKSPVHIHLWGRLRRD